MSVRSDRGRRSFPHFSPGSCNFEIGTRRDCCATIILAQSKVSEDSIMANFSGKGLEPGRKYGSVSRRTIELRERLQAHMQTKYNIENYDPVIALAEMAEDTTAPLDLRAACHKAILPYVHAQIKAIELSGPDGGAIEVKTNLVNQVAAVLDADFTEVEEAESEDLDKRTALPAPPKNGNGKKK